VTKILPTPLVAQVVAGLGEADSDRLPPAPRTHAESALACVAATGQVPAAAELEEDDLLTRTARLAIQAHERAGHGEPGTDGCGCVVAAAAIGAAAAWGAPGSTVIGAVALGLELERRLAQGLGPGHQEVGWCVGGTAGPPAAALTGALVAQAAADRVAHAIGIATSLTLGHAEASATGTATQATPGRALIQPRRRVRREHSATRTGDVGVLHVGTAAANGLLAAALAVQGSTASATALEGPRGYFHVFGADAAADVVLDGLGQRWSIEAPTGERSRPGAEEPTDPFVAELRAAATAGRARGLARQLLELPAEEIK
jgi:2-methylcitrate dehydratase PrpD